MRWCTCALVRLGLNHDSLASMKLIEAQRMKIFQHPVGERSNIVRPRVQQPHPRGE